jgi:exo-beta-1,3-glucanase (GH17 family)
MIVGAWIHEGDGMTAEQQIPLAAESGLGSIRSYDFSYAQRAAPALQQHNLSLLAGMHINGQELVADWQSQLLLEELEAYHQLGIRLEAICVGNELREGGDEPGKKIFTDHLSHNLANLLNTYRTWLDEHGFSTPLTYAMEGIVFDGTGNFLDWVWPVVEACDIVGVNSYPMDAAGWFTFGAFDESRRFLRNPGIRRARLAEYEARFRLLQEQLKKAGKPLLLTETGFPSAIGYRREGERLIVPESDNALYGEAMQEFLALIHRLDDEYSHPIRGLYFYEWRDNLHHDKIWNVEGSPIHTAFGLCDRFGTPKFNIKKLITGLV